MAISQETIQKVDRIYKDLQQELAGIDREHTEIMKELEEAEDDEEEAAVRTQLHSL